MKIQGNFSSPSAQLIDIELVRCENKHYCKSPEEINEFLRNKFFLLMYNQIRFDTELYKTESFVHESITEWITINTQTI